MIHMQTFLRNRDQQVGRYGNPYLRIYGVLARAEEDLDTQVLLDAFEEQFNLPALALQVGDQLRPEREVVGQKNQTLVGIVLDHYPPQRRGVVLAREIAPVYQVKGSGLQHQVVHAVDFVGFAFGDVNEAGDVASQIQQGMQLDGSLGRLKRRQ
jgi:hypothetical protein